MKVIVWLVLISLSLITFGYAHQLAPSCSQKVVVKYIPRNVYDEMIHQSNTFDSVNHNLKVQSRVKQEKNIQDVSAAKLRSIKKVIAGELAGVNEVLKGKKKKP